MIVLTIDTDWAPEEATRAVLAKVQALGIKVTVFFSAPPPAPLWPLLEIGAHPDLSRRQAPPAEGGPLASAGPEHDRAALEAEAEILGCCRQALPEARAVRTHRFYWHSDLPPLMARAGFLHDSSLILPYQPGLMGFRVGRLTRWPVWASDHLHLVRRFPLDRLEIPYWDRPGLKIFCFHVAYLHLNVSRLEDFNMIKTRLTDAVGPASAASRSPGVWDLFQRLADRVRSRSGGLWLRDLPEDFILNNRSLPTDGRSA